MGLGLSLRTLYEVARIVTPVAARVTFTDIERSDADARLRDFARRVVEAARIDIDLRGADQIDVNRSYVYMSNHQSHADIPVLYHTIPTPTLRMVAKTELFKIPIFGRAMRGGEMVEVDRSDHERAVESLRRAQQQIRSGVSLWIAPEGKRSRDGNVQPLKRGGFHLARQTNTPIVPIALSGTYRILPPGARSMRPDVSVRVVFGPAIDIDGRSVDELMTEVAEFLRDNVDRELTRD